MNKLKFLKLTFITNKYFKILNFSKVCPTTSGRASGAILATDNDGGVSILSLREQLCLLSDAGYGNNIESIDWTLDGFLMIFRSDGSLKVWDSYSMSKEREVTGSGQ